MSVPAIAVKLREYVIPAKAGIHPCVGFVPAEKWIPAFAGMTARLHGDDNKFLSLTAMTHAGT